MKKKYESLKGKAQNFMEIHSDKTVVNFSEIVTVCLSFVFEILLRLCDLLLN